MLNAAATPAAPPAITTVPRSATRVMRWLMFITAAASCTVGPSRPTLAPHSTAPIVSNTLATTVRTEISPVTAPAGSSRAAITCGMPEPRASGTQRRVTHTSAMKPSGVVTSGTQRQRAAKCPNNSPISSDALANSTATMPITTAPVITATRRRNRMEVGPRDRISARTRLGVQGRGARGAVGVSVTPPVYRERAARITPFRALFVSPPAIRRAATPR